MALAAVLRAIGLDGGLWLDEILTLIDSVRRPVAQIVTTFPSNNQHTLYSVLAHASIALFGDEAWSLRLPAALFGVATIPALYFLAREFVGRTEALLGCLLLAVSYHHVWFSQNARGYTMLAFLTVVSTALLLRGLRSGRAGYYVAYGITAALRRVHAPDDGVRRDRPCRRVRAAPRRAALRSRGVAALGRTG